MPNRFVYSQKGRGKVSGSQQTAVDHAGHDQEGLSPAISNSHKNDQFH